MEKVSKEGVITVKEGHMIEDEIKIMEGICFDHRFISPVGDMTSFRYVDMHV